ncbi:MAG: hypothetical protein AAGC71_14155 [Pseudomonadota bacterium]
MRDASKLNRYQFETGTAEFLICVFCGVPPVVISEINNTTYAVVNVNALELPEGTDVQASNADFSGERVDSRLERRTKNWIPVVRVEYSPV